MSLKISFHGFETSGTAFNQWKTALDAQATQMENDPEMPWLRSPEFLKDLGIELSKMTSLFQLGTSGQPLSSRVSIRFLALHKLAPDFLDIDVVKKLTPEQAIFLRSLLTS